MPYAKSKSRFNQKRYYKKSYKPVTANTVAKIARSVVRKQNPTKEFRFTQNSSLSTLSLGNSFLWDSPTNIAQGAQENQRVGDSIFMCGVRLKFAISNPLSTDRQVRVMVIQDRNQAGQLLDTVDWDNLFTNNAEADTVATGTLSDVLLPINSQYKIYSDKTFTLQADGRSAVVRNYYVPIMRKIKYDNLGASTALESGKVYVIMHLSEMKTTGDSTISPGSIFCRVFYKDV